jgi:hypothetical protein
MPGWIEWEKRNLKRVFLILSNWEPKKTKTWFGKTVHTFDGSELQEALDVQLAGLSGLGQLAETLAIESFDIAEMVDPQNGKLRVPEEEFLKALRKPRQDALEYTGKLFRPNKK